MERTTTNSLVPFQPFQLGRMKLRHGLTFLYATSSPPTPPPGATRYNLLHTLAGSIERVGGTLLSADEKNNNWTHLLRTPRRKPKPQLRGMQRHISRVRSTQRHHLRVPADPGTRAIRNWTRRTWPKEQPVSSFCLLYTSPSPRDRQKSRMPSSA